MDTSRKLSRCATAGCNSSVLKTNGKHCLKHNARMLYGSISDETSTSTTSSATSSHSSNVAFRSRSQRTKDTVSSLSQNAHHTSRGSLGVSSITMSPQQSVRNTTLPPDMLNRHAMIARKTIGGPPSQRSPLNSSSPASVTSSTRHGLEKTNLRFFSQGLRSPDKTADGKSVQKSPLVNGESHSKAAKSNSGEPKAAFPSTRAVSQSSSQSPQSSQQSTPNRDALRTETNHQTTVSREQVKASISSNASSGMKYLRSIPVVKTNLRPPTSIKSAPQVTSTASTISVRKRKRNPRSGSTSESCSADETDEDGPQSATATTAPVVTQHARQSPRPRGGAAASFTAEVDAGALGPAGGDGTARSNPFSYTPNIHNFISDPDRPMAFASHDPCVIAGKDSLGEGSETVEVRKFPPNIANQDLHISLATPDSPNQRLFPEKEAQWRTRPRLPKEKKTCEERRLELCVEFNEARFDAMIYGQPEAASPPENVFIPATSTYPTSVPTAEKNRQPFYMRLDPRIHWPHNRSEEWYERKMEEISARGGRKANFGEAARRMREHRIAEERRAAKEHAERATAARQGHETPPPYSPPEPWSYRRPMDFGDVPEHELPSYVRENKDWLRAAASMRDNRQRTLWANKLQAAGEPWEHLFEKDKNGRYIIQHFQSDESRTL